MTGAATGKVCLDGQNTALQAVAPRWAVSVPLMATTAACGFPSPADDYLDKPLDFNELLIGNLSATVCVRVGGDSMIPVLFPGDYAVIDRSLTPTDRRIVLVCLDGEFTIKRLRIKDGRRWLQPENPAYQPIFLNEDRAFTIEGVLWWALRRL